jgi:2,3,4,5-tetrahydropyridine-2,6-dicarboxylate N-succinyltransferase
MSNNIYALAIGVGTHNSNGDWLEVFFPAPVLEPEADITAVLGTLGYEGGNVALPLSTENVGVVTEQLTAAGLTDAAAAAHAMSASERPLVACVLATDEAPSSVPEAYLKLHLLSYRLVKPHGTNLDGTFGILPNVAWTNEGAIDIAELADRQLQARLKNRTLEVSCIDKFPKMTNYVVPSGVRIAHTARVRLGAYLGEGTTVMHEGFVNFNAGTEGPGMIEGRISAGVMIGAGSDLGGGASTMGTLSGGGKLVNGMGEGCLVGANGGVGIPLGNNCIVEAGLYLTAGTKLNLLDSDGEVIEQLKAQQLAGKSDLLFRRNSANGAVECLTHKTAVELNEELHAHN